MPGMPPGVLTLDRAENVGLYKNPGTMSARGPGGGLVFPFPRFFRALAEEVRPALASPLERPCPPPPPDPGVVPGKERVRNDELLVQRPDGSRLPVLVDAAPVRDSHGRLIGAVNCWRDITERKRMEDVLRAQAAQAESRRRLDTAQLAGRLQIATAIVLVGGETLHASLVETFRRAWPASRVVNTY